MTKIKITIEQLKQLDRDYSGVCLACGEISQGDTEPDAENYNCELCGENKVMGSHWLPYSDRVELI